MANEENLLKGNPETQFKSGREAIENGRKGGKASGKSRRNKKQLKDCMSTLLALDIKNPDTLELFECMGIKDKSNKMLITLGLFQAAASGDVKAFKEVRNLIGEDTEKGMEDLDEVLAKIEGNI